MRVIAFCAAFLLLLAPAWAQNAEPAAIDFAAREALLDLGPSVSPHQVSDPANPGGAWFTIAVKNESGAAASRILTVADTPRASITVAPMAMRPHLQEVASSESSVTVERAYAFGPNAFRIVVPATLHATLALHFQGVQLRPSVYAWAEPALIAHNRQAAILAGMVAGLLTAAAAFAAGVAALTARPLAYWSALFLAAVLFSDLAAAGIFDNSFLTALGGPYGLSAFGMAVALAAGLRLIDSVVPFASAWRPAAIWRDRGAVMVVAIGLCALAGVPACGLFIRLLAVVGAAAAAGYLAHQGRADSAAARRLAPAAAIFALVTAAATFHALGLFGTNIVAPMAIGGFAAAGALLIALASAAIPLEMSQAAAPAMPVASEPPRAPKERKEGRDDGQRLNAVAASHQGVFNLDLETGLLSLSAEAAGLLGLPPGALELNREAWLQRIHPEDRDVYEQAITTYRSDPGLAFRLEFRTRIGERTHWFELRATMTGQSTEAERCLGLIADITTRKSAETPEAAPVLTDTLTGLANRNALMGRLEALRPEAARLMLAVFDLDRFKSVNTTLGPHGADALLRAVAQRLNERFARTSTLFRVGGDMFAVLTTSGDGAAFGQSILELMSEPFRLQGREIYLPASVGVAPGKDASDAQDFLAIAELAMVQAKRDGGSRVCLYSAALEQGTQADPVALDTGLRRALERGEIEIHYQQIVRLADNTVAGFEALSRWRHPSKGMIEPGAFVEHAERTGLIIPLGKLALKRAAEDLARWQKFFPLETPLFASVNVAWRQIADGTFAQELEAVLKTTGLVPETLRIEITESAVMKGAGAAEAALKRLRDLGVGLAIDDFGTGHSALAHLRRFPFDTIKIDRSFLEVAHDDEAGATILASIVKLAAELGLSVVAEGVQSEEDARRLRALGCEYGQGYLYGAPVPASDVPGIIASSYGR